MFFTSYTTPIEQRKGSVAYDTLMDRFNEENASKAHSGKALAVSELWASVLVGNKVYELEAEIVRDDPVRSGIFWRSYAATGEGAVGGDAVFLRGQPVPLDLANLIKSLCSTFGLDPDVVRATAVDLDAYWDRYDDVERAKIPRGLDRDRYLLIKVRGLEVSRGTN
jgi:hypothetical protein